MRETTHTTTTIPRRPPSTYGKAVVTLLLLGPAMRADAQSPAPPTGGPATASSAVPSAPDRPLPVRTAAERDRAAVTALVEGVARDADLRLWDRVAAAFADRVAFDYGTPETLSGAEILERWRPLLGGFDGTRHELRDVRVAVDGDRATSTSRFHATHVLRGAAGGDTWVLDGRYQHEAARTPAGWKLTRIRMVPGRSTGNAALVQEVRRRAAAAGERGGNTPRPA